MSTRNREQKPEFPVCGCAGQSKPTQGGYTLRFMIDVLERMNGQPASAEVKSGAEDDRNWVRQVADRTVSA